MERNKAHDILHVWNGNMAENCPVCNGTLKADEEVINAAKDVAAENFYPRMKPGLGEAIYCDENGNPIDKEGKDIPDEKPKDDTKTMDEKAPQKPASADTKAMTEKHPGFMTDVLSFADSGSAELPK